ncbi:MAG: ThiF family adenylyltransferase [bacterium]|nr:ThiF family adenylyltransferase [bacterium]
MKIIIIGCGTTGNAIIPLLEGKITLIDRDIVEERNLDRQRLYTKRDIAQPKAEILGKKFHYDYKIMDLDYSNISILKGNDLIIDCTDNLETRFLINEYCSKNKIPWIYTGIVGSQARVMASTGDFCFRCVFAEVKGLETCTTVGVNLKLAETLGKVVQKEVQKISSGKKSSGLWANGEWIKVKRNKFCPVCKGTYKYLEGKKENIIKFCGSSRYQFKGNFDFNLVKKRLKGKGSWFIHKDFYIFKERVLVKAQSEKEAKKKFAEIIGS